MREAEVKILEIDRKKILRRLKHLRARKVFSGRIETFYFDHPKQKLKKKGKVLRLRQKGSKFELTLKVRHHKREAKVMDEYEIPIGDFRTGKKILSELGFQVTRIYRKHRLSYAYKNCHFELDTYRGIPTFLEIEAPSVSQLKKMIRYFGFRNGEAKSWSTFDLMRHYGKV